MPALAGRYRLAAVERGGVTELRPIAHRCVDVEHGPLADDDAPAERDPSGLDSPRLRPVTLEERLPADDRPRADGEQIGAYRYAPGEDRDARADLRAERPQIRRVDGRTDEQEGARVRSDQGLDEPEADVRQAPEADRPGLPATDEHPFRQDRRGAHDEKGRGAAQHEPQVDL